MLTDDSQLLELAVDPSFLFNYRNKIALVPPYEKRQYYSQTEISNNMLERIEYYLICYGVDKNFAKLVREYMVNNTTNSLDPKKIINNFLIFTEAKTPIMLLLLSRPPLIEPLIL